jgi:hypothetical protein
MTDRIYTRIEVIKKTPPETEEKYPEDEQESAKQDLRKLLEDHHFSDEISLDDL